MKKTVWIVSLLWLGCVGDDGTEVIGSYAPPGDTSEAEGEESPLDGTVEGEDVLEVDAPESDGAIEDTSEADVSESDTSEEDTTEADVSEADVSEADVSESDTSEEDTTEGDVSEGDVSEEESLIGFGESCEASQECETALCIVVGSGKICSSYCDDLECPEGFACETNDDEVVPYCQPIEG